jgi:hypothetical protein
MRFSRQAILAGAAALVVASVISFAGPTAYAAWTATATANFSQSSAVVPGADLANGTCVTNLGANTAYMTWPAAPATMNGAAFQDYFIEWIYSTNTPIASIAKTAANATMTGTGLTGTSYVRVTLRYANGQSSVSPTSYNLKVSTDGDKSPMCNPEKP